MIKVKQAKRQCNHLNNECNSWGQKEYYWDFLHQIVSYLIVSNVLM